MAVWEVFVTLTFFISKDKIIKVINAKDIERTIYAI